MMPTKELQEVFKDAQAVASLESTDRLAVIGEDGSPKKISGSLGKTKSFNNVSKGSWIRIGVSDMSARSSVVLFSAYQSWNNATPGSILVAAMFGSAEFGDCFNNGSIRLLAGANKNSFPKARFVCKTSGAGGVVYLDLYMNVSNPLNVISVINHLNFNIDISTTATIPEGYSVKEFDLTVVGGG